MKIDLKLVNSSKTITPIFGDIVIILIIDSITNKRHVWIYTQNTALITILHVVFIL